MLPLKIGAALNAKDLPLVRDWIFDDQRDLEIQDFAEPHAFLGNVRETVASVKEALDGFQGRLGMHGPFWGLDIANPEPSVAETIANHYLKATEIAAEIGAQQMVVHSPFDHWHQHNAFNFGGRGESDVAEKTAEDVRRVLGPALALAQTEGVTLVVENIKDTNPRLRREMVEFIGSTALALSVDTGHAQIAQRALGAPPVDVFVKDAGSQLRHVHIQDTDGYADRHWKPGEGHIEWVEVFRALAELDSQPHLVLELLRTEDIPKGFEYLQKLGLAI